MLPRAVNPHASTVIVLLLLFAASVSVVTGQQPRPVIEGSWIATFGQRQFRGEWSAQALGTNTNAAVGSWTLFDDGEQIVMRGTWSAEKAANRWDGSWSARVENGPVLSGTWGADPKTMAGKSFEDMLRQTAEKQIAGWWRRGAAQQGNWWLRALGWTITPEK